MFEYRTTLPYELSSELQHPSNALPTGRIKLCCDVRNMLTTLVFIIFLLFADKQNYWIYIFYSSFMIYIYWPCYSSSYQLMIYLYLICIR